MKSDNLNHKIYPSCIIHVYLPYWNPPEQNIMLDLIMLVNI